MKKRLQKQNSFWNVLLIDFDSILQSFWRQMLQKSVPKFGEKLDAILDAIFEDKMMQSSSQIGLGGNVILEPSMVSSNFIRQISTFLK